MKKKNLFLLIGVSVGGLLALFLMFFYCFFQTEELEHKIAGLEVSLEESETQRISDAYEFQRKLEQLSGGVPEPEKTPSPDFASALRDGEIQSVLVPTPAVPTLDPLNMDSRQIADTVVTLCENNGYSYINLYLDLLNYTASLNLSLDDILHDGTHPSPSGYLRLWRLIASELKLNVELNDFYDADLTASEIPETVVQIGVNRSDITEQTNLYAQDQAGQPIFPQGDSIYLTTDPFGETAPYGVTLITHRYPGKSGGYQILKPVYGSSNYIRYANEDGS